MTRLAHDLMVIQILWEKIPADVKFCLLMIGFIAWFFGMIVFFGPDDPHF